MKFVVGIDLRPGALGAQTFAAWVRSEALDSTFAAAHAIRISLRTMDSEFAEAVRRKARDQTASAIYAAGIEDADLVVVAEREPIDLLCDTADKRDAHAVLIGRQAPTDQRRIVRLGATARRLLRRLPTTVVVAPPDLAQIGVGGGPVLLALDGRTGARRAATFAREFAEQVNRPLEVVHVSEELPLPSWPYAIDDPDWTRRAQADIDAERSRIERTASDLGLAKAAIHETQGAVVEALASEAERLGACLLVCSSRELSPAARLFTSSVGSALSANARFPVAVVPSREAV